LENVRRDYFEGDLSVEERLVKAAVRDQLRMGAGIVGPEGRYSGVGEYDPVLRSHCRLVEPRE
jgi:hypothetical protein